MKFTLRKANALQTAIQDHIKTLRLVTEVSINEFQNSVSEITKARDTFMANHAAIAALSKVVYDVRAKIGRANVESGVSDLLTHAAYVDKRLSSLSGLVGCVATEAQEVIDGKLEKIRAAKGDTTRYYGADVVAVSIINDEIMDTLKADQASLKKEKQTINDKVLELNIRTEIELDTDAVSLLQSVQLL